MDKLLVIAEKPKVAIAIADALGCSKRGHGYPENDQVVVGYAFGHLVELYVPDAEAARDFEALPVIPEHFQMRPIDGAREKLSNLQAAIRRSDIVGLVNACDAGREGELIFRLIVEHAGRQLPIERMWIKSMTPDALRAAFHGRRPGREFENLAAAARSRSEADWIVGINASRAVTRLLERQTGASVSMSAGRVQSPTLAILVHRERDIAAFVASDFYEVQARFVGTRGDYLAHWIDPATGNRRRFVDRGDAESIAARCRGVSPSEVVDTLVQKARKPPALFDLTALQREASRRFKFSAKRTEELAQSLYDTHKAISYPRTDSSALPEDYVGTACAIVAMLAQGRHSAEALPLTAVDAIDPELRVFDDAKVSDHFAIIPTSLSLDASESPVSDDERRIYDLVVLRFLAAFYPDQVIQTIERRTTVAGEVFLAKSSSVTEAGWTRLLAGSDEPTDATCSDALPPVDGEVLTTETVDVLQGRTTPPNRMTEADLLGAMVHADRLVDNDALRDAMKDRGLGTPATRGAIIEKLLERRDRPGSAAESYVVREGKSGHLVPTARGTSLVDVLEQHGGADLVSAAMTGEWEFRLHQVEKGAVSRPDFMQEIGSYTRELILAMRSRFGAMPAFAHPTLEAKCPACGGALIAEPKTVDCKACGWKLWREVASRYLGLDEVDRLVAAGQLEEVDGFVSKSRKKFRAGLLLREGGKVDFIFAGTSGPGEELESPCRACGGVIAHVGKQFACSSCDVRMWDSIAGRQMSVLEIEQLLREGQTPLLEGFVSSKTKRKFKARLRMTTDGKRADFAFD